MTWVTHVGEHSFIEMQLGYQGRIQGGHGGQLTPLPFSWRRMISLAWCLGALVSAVNDWHTHLDNNLDVCVNIFLKGIR